MADDLYTIADMVANSMDLSDAEVSDLLQDAPFFAMLPAVESTLGSVHKYVKETGAPVVGFRAENAGREFDASADTIVTINLKILDFSFAVDKAVADNWKGGAESFIDREGRRHLRSAFFKAEKQYIQGTVAAGGGDTTGFTGFANAVTASVNPGMFVNAGGTTANTASSCYLVRVGEDDVAGVMNGDGIELGESIIQDMIDSNDKHFPAYYTPGCTWLGIQVGSNYSFGRIGNLTEDAGKGLTDDLVYEAISAFPSGRQPTHIVMNRRSLEQLRKSRTATNATGSPAPTPTEVNGVPIVVTDAIGNTEALLSDS